MCGEKNMSKFIHSKIFITFLCSEDIKFSVIFSFGNEGFFVSTNGNGQFKNRLKDIINSEGSHKDLKLKQIKIQIDSLVKNESAMNELMTKVSQIKNRKKRLAILKSSNHENKIIKNMDVLKSYSNFLKNRINNHIKDEIKVKVAEDQRKKAEITNILFNAVSTKKWDMKKLMVS